MRNLCTLLCVILLLISTTAHAQRSFTLPVQEGDIKVYHGEETVYFIATDPKAEFDPSWWDGSLFFVEFMGVPADKNKFVRIDEVTHTVNFLSSNDKVLQFERGNVNGLNGVFNILKPGKATVTISVGTEAVHIPIEAVKLPVHYGMTGKAIIKALGKPDSRAKSAENTGTHKIGKRLFQVAMENWTYSKYPGLLLLVDPISGLSGWRMLEWDEVDKR